MKRYIQLTSPLIALAMIVAGAVSVLIAVHPAGAVNVFESSCGGGSGGTGTGTGGTGNTGGAGGSAGGGSLSGTSSGGTICDSQGDDFYEIMKTIINTILMVLGMVAVIMIVIGGIRYTTSNGEASQIQSAKNTVLYAVVGLIVAIFAYAIVNFVIEAFI